MPRPKFPFPFLRRQPPSSPHQQASENGPLPAAVVRSSTASHGVGGNITAGSAAPHPLDSRGTTVHSMMASPSSSSSSGHASMLGGVLSSPSLMSGATSSSGAYSSNSRKSPIASVQQRLRNLGLWALECMPSKESTSELNNLAISLPGTPRRRLPSTTSMEQGAKGPVQKAQSGSSLTASLRHQQFTEVRSLSTQSSEVTRRSVKAKTMIPVSKD